MSSRKHPGAQPNAVLEMDRQCRIQGATRATASVLGAAVDTLVGSSLRELLVEPASDAISALIDVQRSGVPTWLSLRFRGAHGVARCLVRAVPGPRIGGTCALTLELCAPKTETGTMRRRNGRRSGDS